MASVNKVILVGNLGKDPEVRYSGEGAAIATLSLATTDRWKDKNTGETKEQTEWHRVVLFGRSAEVAGEYLRKGRQVFVEGKLRTRKWTDKEGQERYTTEIVADGFQMLGNREGGGGGGGGGGHGDDAGGPVTARPAARPAPAARQAPASVADDDDIPF